MLEQVILLVNSGIMQTSSSAAGESIGRSGGAVGLIDIVNECLSERGQECVDGLASTAMALDLRDVSSSAMLVAALAAVSAAQATQDEEEQVYDLIKQLEAQASVTAALLDSLNSTLSELQQASVKTGVQAEKHQQKVPEDMAKVDKYKKQQKHFASRLQALGYDSKFKHTQLRALGHQHAQLAAELKTAEAQEQHYVGLPADMEAAKAVHLEKLQELERLRERLAAGLAVL